MTYCQAKPRFFQDATFGVLSLCLCRPFIAVQRMISIPQERNFRFSFW